MKYRVLHFSPWVLGMLPYLSGLFFRYKEPSLTLMRFDRSLQYTVSIVPRPLDHHLLHHLVQGTCNRFIVLQCSHRQELFCFAGCAGCPGVKVSFLLRTKIRYSTVYAVRSIKIKCSTVFAVRSIKNKVQHCVRLRPVKNVHYRYCLRCTVHKKQSTVLCTFYGP